MEPELFCQLGHFNLLLEDYPKGEWPPGPSVLQNVSDRLHQCWVTTLILNMDHICCYFPIDGTDRQCFFHCDVMNSNNNTLLCILITALSAYQRYYSLQSDYWKVRHLNHTSVLQSSFNTSTNLEIRPACVKQYKLHWNYCGSLFIFYIIITLIIHFRNVLIHNFRLTFWEVISSI